jgi:predicted transcriptional regulator
LDHSLKILENPVRRKIVERLSQEPNYSLRISKELGLGQQLVTKHLNIMENSGIVKTKIKSSPLGPRRRIFSLAKSFSIIIDVAPNLFKQNIITFDVEPDQYPFSDQTISLIEKRDKIFDFPIGIDKMKPFSNILKEIDNKLENLEQERTLLLSIRNSIMKEASKIIQRINDSDSRRVFHSALDEHDSSAKKISESLNLREEKVRKIIQKLKNEFATEYFQ